MDNTKKYNEDARWQGFVTSSTANWMVCESINCKFINVCEKNHINFKPISCKYSPYKPLVNIDKKLNIEEVEFKATKHNASGTTFLENIMSHCRGDGTPSLTFTDIVLSTNYIKPERTSQLGVSPDDDRELTRASCILSGQGVVVIARSGWGKTQALTASTVITATPTLLNEFIVNDVTGFNAGDLIQIIDPLTGLPYGEVGILSIDIPSKKITTVTELKALPAINFEVDQMINRIYLVTQGTGALTGITASVSELPKPKTNKETLAIEFLVNLRGN